MNESHQATDKKVAVFLADGCEEIEALTVVDLLYRAGIPVTTVSISGSTLVTGSHKIRITADICIHQSDIDSFDMLVLPGGMPGTSNLAACTPLTEAVCRFVREGKQVAAICAAPTILAGLGLLEGKEATCYPGREPDMCGAVLTHESTAVSGNIITGRGMGCAIPFGLKIVAHYLGDEAAAALGENVVWNVGKDGKAL